MREVTASPTGGGVAACRSHSVERKDRDDGAERPVDTDPAGPTPAGAPATAGGRTGDLLRRHPRLDGLAVWDRGRRGLRPGLAGPRRAAAQNHSVVAAGRVDDLPSDRQCPGPGGPARRLSPLGRRRRPGAGCPGAAGPARGTAAPSTRGVGRTGAPSRPDPRRRRGERVEPRRGEPVRRGLSRRAGGCPGRWPGVLRLAHLRRAGGPTRVGPSPQPAIRMGAARWAQGESSAR
jgi:hypothetical protein